MVELAIGSGRTIQDSYEGQSHSLPVMLYRHISWSGSVCSDHTGNIPAGSGRILMVKGSRLLG